MDKSKELMDSLDLLNEQQRQAVVTTEGPLLVVAGAGSGKTRVLTQRVAYILCTKQVDPWSILCITFTNKAAMEMRKRIWSMLKERGKDSWIYTFHSLCARILRSDIHHLGYDRSFVIMDIADQNALIKEISLEQNIDAKKYPPRIFRSRISMAKNKGVNPTQMLEQAKDVQEELVGNLFKRYETRMRDLQSLDFDDLLWKTLDLMDKFPEVASKYASKFHYVHVDEYQDTNHIQYGLLRKLVSKHRNICVVGDTDQSIYSFRGADSRNITQLRHDFPDLQTIALEQNYRSTKVILAAANHLIQNNPIREKKNLWTSNDEGDKIYLYNAYNEWDEASYVVKVIMDAHKNGKSYADHAILCRTNAQTRVMEETLLKSFVPYRVFGGMRFYDRKEIKDILAYLRLLILPSDDTSFIRIVNIPRRGVGNVTVDRLRASAFSLGRSLFEMAKSSTHKGLVVFVSIIEKIKANMDNYQLPELIDYILAETGYLTWLQQQDKGKAEDRLAYLDEFRSLVANFSSNQGSDQLSIKDKLTTFLTDVALITDVDMEDEDQQNPANDMVQLMTFHSAKGLEFPNVFLIGMEEETVPHMRALLENPQEGLWEERRLIYVALTRAQKSLHIIHAKSRTHFAEIVKKEPSRFLGELPSNLLMSVGQNAHIRQYQSKQRIMLDKNVFLAGDKLKHDKWGQGEVVFVDTSGDLVTIQFADPIGKQRLHLAYAPLTKLDDHE